MVKVSAPAMSLEASGKLGGSLVFSKWKGRPYVRALVKPSNPRTGPQTGVRAMMRFLSQAWKALGSTIWSDWEDRAKETTISPFNAYISYNMARWRRFLGCSQLDPATEASTANTVSAITATGAIRQIAVSITPTAATALWAYAIFRDAAAPTTAFSSCIAVILANGASAVLYVDTPLAPGTWHYKAKAINTDGKFGTDSADCNGTAT
jgi:hypothetical protein